MANSAIANGFPVPTTFDDNIYVVEFECNVCGDIFKQEQGIFPCMEHFYCDECTVKVINRSLRNIDEFPASCCALSRDGIFPFQFAHLLGAETMAVYFRKLEESQTPKSERVYCANFTCAAFLPSDQHKLTEGCFGVGVCKCGTSTCVNCKTEWQLDHFCLRCEDTFVKPEWLPEYSADCRIKPCPGCHEWIELSEACNHMTCALCNHQFCFICLLPWVKPHEAEGCPMYGDPSDGYNKEGYDRIAGLHLYTGRDYEGYDRRGVDEFGRYVDGIIAPSESEASTNDDIVDLDYGWEEELDYGGDAADSTQAHPINPNLEHRQNGLGSVISDFGEEFANFEEWVETQRP